MNKKIITICALIFSILLVLLSIVRVTYSLIIDATNEDNLVEPKRITINDIITDGSGEYNRYYYNIITELNITKKDCYILINSVSLNNVLNVILNNVILSRYNSMKRFTSDEVYNLIVDGINHDSNINSRLKNKVIAKVREHISDIVKYLYDIETK